MGYFPYQLVSDLFFNINSRTHRILTLDSTFEVVFHSLPFSWLQRCVCGLGTPPKKWAKRNSKNSFWASNCYTPQEVEELGQSTATTVWKMQNQMAFTKQHPVVMVLFCFRQAMWLMNNMKAPRDRKKIIKPGSKHRWFCLETLDAPKLILHAETALAGFVGFLSDTLWLESLKT